MEVYVSESHPFYFVNVDGRVYDTFIALSGPPLTWSDQWDVANGYKEALENYRPWNKASSIIYDRKGF